MTMDKYLDQLAARARCAPTPAVDVTGRVMARLAAPGLAAPGADTQRPLLWMAAASALAAGLAVAFYYSSMMESAWTDPLWAMVFDFTGGLV